MPEYADIEYGPTVGSTDEMYADVDDVMITGLELHNPGYILPLAGAAGFAPPTGTKSDQSDLKTKQMLADDADGGGNRRWSRSTSYDNALDCLVIAAPAARRQDACGNPPNDNVYADAGIFQPPPVNPGEDDGADDMVYDNGEAGATADHGAGAGAGADKAIYPVAELDDTPASQPTASDAYETPASIASGNCEHRCLFSFSRQRCVCGGVVVW